MIKYFLFVFLLMITMVATAQKTNPSPYSFFGIGEEFNPVTVEQNSMGGIGVAFSHYKYLNFTNPAAYADLKYTTYSFGVLNNELTIADGSKEETATSTSLSYFAFAFPMGSKAAISVGIQPVSSVGYSLTNSVLDAAGDVSEITVFSGEGGVNRIYGSVGIKIFKEFSFGIEAAFNFGSIEKSVTNQKVDVSLATKSEENSIVRGGSVTFGGQYKKVLKNKFELNVGAAVKMENNLKVTGDEYLYSLSLVNVTEIGKDTISQSRINGSYKFPLKTILGVGFGEFNKWYVGLEYENQGAIETTGLLNDSNARYRYDASNRFSLGGYYLPKVNSISSYWERITYRVGVRFEKIGLLVDGSGLNTNFTSIDDFGVSFGLGLPLKQLSTLNMGFEFGKRGTTINNLIEENYFNFRVSLSLTDTKWFQKRKID